MTKDEALDLALEELENCADLLKMFEAPIDSCVGATLLQAEKAITAIKQARALDKMADNARELGLDYEPVQEMPITMQAGDKDCRDAERICEELKAKVEQGQSCYCPNCEALSKELAALKAQPAPAHGCDFCNHPLYAGTKCKNCGREPAPVQDPVAWSPALNYPNYERGRVWCNGKPRQEDIECWSKTGGITLAYTTPPAQPADQGQSCYCPNCEALSKELAALKAQPAPVQEQIESAKQIWREDQQRIAELSAEIDRLTAAQRQWVGLTDEDIDIAFDDTQEGGGFNEFAYAIEKRLKEKNT